MNKKEILEQIEKKIDKAWLEYSKYCRKIKVYDDTDLKARELLGRWLALEDLYDELDEELK